MKNIHLLEQSQIIQKVKEKTIQKAAQFIAATHYAYYKKKAAPFIAANHDAYYKKKQHHLLQRIMLSNIKRKPNHIESSTIYCSK